MAPNGLSTSANAGINYKVDVIGLIFLDRYRQMLTEMGRRGRKIHVHDRVGGGYAGYGRYGALCADRGGGGD